MIKGRVSATGPILWDQNGPYKTIHYFDGTKRLRWPMFKHARMWDVSLCGRFLDGEPDWFMLEVTDRCCKHCVRIFNRRRTDTFLRSQY